MASSSNVDPSGLNVLGRPLEVHGTEPVTGFFRDGFCRPSAHDPAEHTLAGILSTEFLEFSRSKGNDLMTPHPAYGFPGLKDGCRWCLCVSRWKEALLAAKDHPNGDKIIPKVNLDGTSMTVLNTVKMEDLRKHQWGGGR